MPIIPGWRSESVAQWVEPKDRKTHFQGGDGLQHRKHCCRDGGSSPPRFIMIDRLERMKERMESRSDLAQHAYEHGRSVADLPD